MVDILDFIPEFDSYDEAHLSVEFQCLTKGFSHKNKKLRRKRATLSETTRGLKSFTWSTINHRGNPGPKDASSDKV